MRRPKKERTNKATVRADKQSTGEEYARTLKVLFAQGAINQLPSDDDAHQGWLASMLRTLLGSCGCPRNQLAAAADPTDLERLCANRSVVFLVPGQSIA
jgi:hypothetical protein